MVGLQKMQNAIGELKIFAGNASQDLAHAIVEKLSAKAEYSGIKMGNAEARMFSDSECDIRVLETVRGMDVFIVQSIAPSATRSSNDHLMELLIMIDAMRRSSAGRITAVVPYLGYARQDRRDRSHAPISAKLVADMITVAGANRILTMDLHSPQVQGFFNIPFDHLSGVYSFINYYSRTGYDLKGTYAVVSPDFGSVARSSIIAEKLEIPLAIIEKRRNSEGEPYVHNFVGDVRGKNVIILDDVIASGGSLREVTARLIKEDAKDIYACITHPMLTGNAMEEIENSPIKEFIVLDTIAIPEEKRHKKLLRLSVAQLFSDAISGIHSHESIGKLAHESIPELL